jgi:hypothetical protein
MRFSLMEKYLERAEVIAFLGDLGRVLDGFVRGIGVHRDAAGDDAGACAAGARAWDSHPPGQPGVGGNGDGGAVFDAGRDAFEAGRLRARRGR